MKRHSKSNMIQNLNTKLTSLSCIMTFSGFLPNCTTVNLVPSKRKILPMLNMKRLTSSKLAAVEPSTINPTRDGSTAKRDYGCPMLKQRGPLLQVTKL